MQKKTKKTGTTMTEPQKDKPVIRIFLATILVVVAIGALPNLLGWDSERVSIATVFLRYLAFTIALAVGGTLASHAFNKDADKALKDRESGRKKITKKYNGEVDNLKAEYDQKKKDRQLSGMISNTQMKLNYTRLYDTTKYKFYQEQKDFHRFWKSEYKRASFFRTLWGWIIILGFLASFGSCSYTLASLENDSSTHSKKTTYWNAQNIQLPHLTDATQYVSNPDSVLSPTTVAEINTYMRQLDTELGIETAVIVVNHIENDDPFRMAQDVGNRFGVGRKDRGLVIVVGYQDHSINMSPGRALEADLTDAECYQLQQRYVVPGMKAEQPDSAMLYLAEALYAFMKNKPMPEMSALPDSHSSDEEEDEVGIVMGLYTIFLIPWFIFAILMDQRYDWFGGSSSTRLRENPFIPQSVYYSSSGGYSGSSHSSGGFGGGFGGGGGGYGGGSFGGGGATSRW